MTERYKPTIKNFRVSSSLFLVLLLLAAAFLFGCNQEDNKESESTYDQTSVDFPADLQDVLALEKTDSGKLWLVGTKVELDSNTSSLWELDDNNSWNEVVNISSLLSLDANDWLTSSPVLKNDTVLSLVVNFEDPSMGLRFYLIDSTLEAGYRKLEISAKDFGGELSPESLLTTVYQLFPLKDGQFIVQTIDYSTQDYEASLFTLDITNEKVAPLSIDRSIELGSILSVVQAEETVYVAYGGLDYHELHVGTLDLSTGSFEDIDTTEHKELTQLLGGSHAAPIMAEGYNADSMAICTADGVYEYSGGNTQKLIDEQESTVLSNPAITTLGIVFDSEDDFFLISIGQYTTGATPQFLLHKYTKTVGDQTGLESTSKLRVWSLEDSDTLRQGIALFRDEHPNVEMELQIGISAEGITPEDAIRALNVEVLAGSGPDVFILDGLQIDSFIEQGLLYDLTDIYTEAKDSGLYYDNIIGAFADQGETRVIPLRYSFPLVAAERSTITKLESLPSLVSLSQEIYESNPESRLFCNLSIIDECFVASYPEIIAEGAIDKEALEQFFDCSEDLYEILKQNNRERSVLPNPSREPFGENELFDIPPRASHYLYEDPTQILMNLVAMESDFALNEIYIQNSEVDIASDVLIFNQFRCFVPSICVAVSADSSEVELSKSFVSMLFSEEVQSVNHNEGLSVSRSTLNNLVGESFAVSFEDNSSFVLESLQEETVVSYQSLITSLDTPVVVDRVVQAAVYEELQRFLDGDISKDEALNNCIKRIELYLAE